MGGCSQSTSPFTTTTNLDEIGLNQKLISHSVHITKPKVHNKREESIECSYIVRSMYVESYALGMPIIAVPPRILVRWWLHTMYIGNGRQLAFQASDSPHTFNVEHGKVRYSLFSFIMYSSLNWTMSAKNNLNSQQLCIWANATLVHQPEVRGMTYEKTTSHISQNLMSLKLVILF